MVSFYHYKLSTKEKREGAFLLKLEMTKGFFSYYEKHWRNKKENLGLIDGILLPYIEKTKKDLNLLTDQKSLLIWDAFTSQNTDAVKNRLSELNILTVNVPENLTHLLQPLDLTTNEKFRNIRKRVQ